MLYWFPGITLVLFTDLFQTLEVATMVDRNFHDSHAPPLLHVEGLWEHGEGKEVRNYGRQKKNMLSSSPLARCACETAVHAV